MCLRGSVKRMFGNLLRTNTGRLLNRSETQTPISQAHASCIYVARVTLGCFYDFTTKNKYTLRLLSNPTPTTISYLLWCVTSAPLPRTQRIRFFPPFLPFLCVFSDLLNALIVVYVSTHSACRRHICCTGNDKIMQVHALIYLYFTRRLFSSRRRPLVRVVAVVAVRARLPSSPDQDLHVSESVERRTLLHGPRFAVRQLFRRILYR